MTLHRLARQCAVAVLIDRQRPEQRGIGEIGELLAQVAAVVVERQHQLVIDQRQALDQHAARIIVVRPGIPDREQRRDRLHRLVAGARQEIARGAQIGDAGGADRAVAPRLRHDPVGDRLVVAPFARTAKGVAGPERGAGTARIDHDHGVAARHEHVAIAVGIGRRLDTLGAGCHFEATDIGREDQDGRPAPAGIAVRQVNVDRQSAAVRHRDI